MSNAPTQHVNGEPLAPCSSRLYVSAQWYGVAIFAAIIIIIIGLLIGRWAFLKSDLLVFVFMFILAIFALGGIFAIIFGSKTKGQEGVVCDKNTEADKAY